MDTGCGWDAHQAEEGLGEAVAVGTWGRCVAEKVVRTLESHVSRSSPDTANLGLLK